MELKDLRIMVVGAHPDDPEFNMAGTVAKYAKAGARVWMVSVSCGDKGHRTMPPAELAKRRYEETQASAATLGAEKYIVLDGHDCELEPTMEMKLKITKLIREFAPHLVFTHRTCDYHADHRAVGQILMDISYFLGVPYWCPQVPVPDVMPAVFFMRDKFTVPRPIRPDVIVDATDVQDVAADALCCHGSQFFEWLPPEIPSADKANPGLDASIEEKRAYIKKFWFSGKEMDAARYGLSMKYPEVFELSEYGRQPTSEEIKEMFPHGALIAERPSYGMY
ncbi:MAG: PIG-L family deacetylase [Kiritimatiellae bacterium]|nr:PIG-L family deacetylase [Kiritimatiellia bacterium]